MERFIVRGVDWANIQRSPTFEVIFNSAIETMSLPINIQFESAGIMVDKILANKSPIRVKLSIIGTGLGYEILPEGISVKAQKLVEEFTGIDEEDILEQVKEEITEVYSEVKDIVHSKQMEYRNKALVERGIPKNKLPGMRNPYRHHPDLKLVLALDKIVIGKLEEFYESIQVNVKRPEIILYGDLVNREPLEDIHTGEMETARNQVKYFQETKETAIKKIIEILSKEKEN